MTTQTHPKHSSICNLGSTTTLEKPAEILFSGPFKRNDVKFVTLTMFNTVLITNDNKIYVYGSRSYGIINGDHGLLSHVPVFLYALNSSFVISNVFSGTFDVFITAKDKVYAIGRNSHGELGTGSQSPLYIPTVIAQNVEFFHNYQHISCYSTKDKVIYCAGDGYSYQLGRDYDLLDSTFQSIYMNAIAVTLQSVDIKDIFTFNRGVFVLLKDPVDFQVWYWGTDRYLALSGAGVDPYNEDFIRFPMSTKLDNIPSGSIVDQISCYKKACFALASKGKQMIFSWGFDPALPITYSAREFTIDNYYLANEINYGELDLNEEVVASISTTLFSTRFVTKSGKIFAFGYNHNSEFGISKDEIPYSNYSIRILHDLSADYPNFDIGNQLTYHFYAIFDEYDYVWVIIVSVSIISVLGLVGLVLLLICIVFVVAFFFIIRRELIKRKSVNKDINDNVMETHVFVRNDSGKEEIELFLKINNVNDDEFDSFLNNWKAKNENIVDKIKLMKFDDLKLLSYLGAGGSGCSVFAAEMKEKEGKDAFKVAYKSFPILFEKMEELFSSKYSKYDEFKRELLIYMRTQHPFVLKIHGLVLQRKNLGLVMEYCACGDMKNFMEKKGNSLSIKERMKILYKICTGMGHLHFNNIIHRDLKLQNILIDQNYNPKIMDFGISRLVINSMTKTKNIGTVKYQAPELVLSGKYDEKVDVFSFAICAYEVLSLDFDPFLSLGEDGNLALKISSNPNFRPNIKKLSKEVKEWFKKVIIKSWAHQPIVRPSFSEICNEFLKSGDVEKDMDIYNIHVQKRDPVTIYVKKEEGNDEAEDVELSIFKVSELERIGKRFFDDANVTILMVDGEEKKKIENDEQVKMIKNDSIILYKV